MHQAETQENIDPSITCGPRCTKYQESTTAQTKPRSKKMRDLKMLIDDESIITVYKDYKTKNCTMRKCAANMEVFKCSSPKEQEESAATPSKHLLAANSASRKSTKKEKCICEICGIQYQSSRDKEYDSAWIGCDHNNCDI